MGLHVVVIVLGDLGRSPRMQYHASSLADLPSEVVNNVTLVGYEGEQTITRVRTHNKILEKRIKPLDYPWLREKSSLIHALVKGLCLMWTLFMILVEAAPYDVILIQNPPALPVVIAAMFINLIRLCKKSRIILDWHNLGYSMFGSWKQFDYKLLKEEDGVLRDKILSIPFYPTEYNQQLSVLVRLAKWMELTIPPLICHYHLCVSEALKLYLHSSCPKISEVMVLYDRPFNSKAMATHSSQMTRPQSIRDMIISHDISEGNETDVLEDVAGSSVTNHSDHIDGNHKLAHKCHELFLRLGFTHKELNFSGQEEEKLLSETTEKGMLCSSTIKTHCYDSQFQQLEGNFQFDNLDNIEDMIYADDVDIPSSRFQYEFRADDTFVLLTSTSWTADEDFELFFTAIIALDKFLCYHHGMKTNVIDGMEDVPIAFRDYRSFYDNVLVIITGKGPLRSLYESRIQEMNLCHIRIQCHWLSSEDYFSLLSFVDAGVCLHTSSSGYDLPMKAYDMLGAHIPVLALNYYAIGELIQHNQNGLLFENSDELVQNILRLIAIRSDLSDPLTQEERERSLKDASNHTSDAELLHGSVSMDRLSNNDNGTDRLSLISTAEELNGHHRTIRNEGKCSELRRMKENILTDRLSDWESNWNAVMKPLMEQIAIDRRDLRTSNRAMAVFATLILSVLVGLFVIAHHLSATRN